MSKKIVSKLLYDIVLVLPSTREEKTASGIIIPSTVTHKPTTGTIVQCGEGSDKPMEVKIGDSVLFPADAGMPIEIKGKGYIIIPQQLLICVL